MTHPISLRPGAVHPRPPGIGKTLRPQIILHQPQLAVALRREGQPVEQEGQVLAAGGDFLWIALRGFRLKLVRQFQQRLLRDQVQRYQLSGRSYSRCLLIP